MKLSNWAACAAIAMGSSLFSSGASAGDFNADGKADILWRQTSTGAVSIWLMNGSTVLSNPGGWTVPTDWAIQGVGDFDGDGKSDVMWRQASSGVVSIWLMNGGTILSNPGGWSMPTNWSIEAVDDFDGDGKADVLWRQGSTGAVSFWFMNGVSILSNPGGWSVPTDWAIQGVGDFNADGKADILWRQGSTGAVSIFMMNGVTVQSNPGGWMVPTDWTIQGVDDFDGDGKADVLWRQTGSGATSVWLMNGATIVSNPGGWSVPVDWVVDGLGDVNADGKADIVWRQTGSGAVSMLLMNGGTVLSNPPGWSVPVDWAIQPPPPTPATPTNLGATPASATSITLAWQDNATNETGFEIERSPNGSTNWVVIATTGADVITYQNTGLTPATTYYYRVRASNRGKKSGNSNGANATTPGVAPTPPTNAVAIAASTSSITLTWQDTSTNETGFRIERSANGSTNWTEIGTTSANVTTYPNTGLAASTAYYYRVRAYNGSGNSTYSNTANATTLAAASSVTIAWDDNATTESGFRVERSPNGSTGWTEIGTTAANVTTYQNTGLAVGTTYYYRVRAYNATELSSYSNTLQVNIP